MGTWSNFELLLCPRAYRKLVMRWRMLLRTKADLSRGGAMRYTLRRLSFTPEQEEAYARAVRRDLDEEGVGFQEAFREALGVEVEGPPPRRRPGPSVRFSVRLDPWSVEKLRKRRGVLEAQLGRAVSRSEAARRILRRLRFTEEQRLVFGEEAMAYIRENDTEVFEALAGSFEADAQGDAEGVDG